MTGQMRGDETGALLGALAADTGGIVTGFVVLATFLGQDGEERVYFDTMAGQRATATLGLLSAATAIETRRFADHWLDDT